MSEETNVITDEKICTILNNSFKKGRNPSVNTLNGEIVFHDRKEKLFAMQFMGTDAMSNGKPKTAGVQGGFAGAFLDCVCANAVVFMTRFGKTVATLEQKCTFIALVKPNIPLYAEAKVIKLGKSIAFLEASLYENDRDGKLLVRATQTNSLLSLPPKPKKSNL